MFPCDKALGKYRTGNWNVQEVSYLNRFHTETHTTYTSLANARTVSYIMIPLRTLILMQPKKREMPRWCFHSSRTIYWQGDIVAYGCVCALVFAWKQWESMKKRVMRRESSQWHSRQHGSCLPTGLKTLQKKTGLGVGRDDEMKEKRREEIPQRENSLVCRYARFSIQDTV